jgi:uncharacterized OB-fold protein/acyl dehydratase
MIQRCDDCESWIFYPRSRCPQCLGDQLQWKQIAGNGTLYTYTVSRRPTYPSFAEEVPQRLAVIRFDEGPHITSTLVNVADDAIEIGMAVEPVFEEQPNSKAVLLRYQPADESRRSTVGKETDQADEIADSHLTEEVLSYIGKVGEPVVGYPISEHEVRRFCYAVDQLNPAYVDPDYAEEGLQVPPAFLSIPFDTDVPLSELSDDGIPAVPKGAMMPALPKLKRRLWGGVEVEFFQKMHMGDVLTKQYRVLDIYERSGGSGSMVFMIMEWTYTNQHGEKVAVEVNTIIAR